MSDAAVTPNLEPQPPAVTAQPTTPALSPEADIHTMPVAELRQQVLDAENVRAAESALQPFTIQQRPEGGYVINFASGELFKGNDREVIAKLAESKVHARDYIDRLKTEVERYKSANPTAPAPNPQQQPTAPQTDPDLQPAP